MDEGTETAQFPHALLRGAIVRGLLHVPTRVPSRPLAAPSSNILMDTPPAVCTSWDRFPNKRPASEFLRQGLCLV